MDMLSALIQMHHTATLTIFARVPRRLRVDDRTFRNGVPACNCILHLETCILYMLALSLRRASCLVFTG